MRTLAAEEPLSHGDMGDEPHYLPQMRRANAPSFIRAINSEYQGALLGVDPPFHIVDPHATRARHKNVAVHSARITRDELIPISGSLLVTTPERTILDLCRSNSTGVIAALMCEMCGLYTIAPSTQRLDDAIGCMLDSQGKARLESRGAPGVAHSPEKSARPWQTSSGGPVFAAFLDVDGARCDYSMMHNSWTPCIGRNGRRTSIWKRAPLCSIESLLACANNNAGTAGVQRFRRALRYVVEGSGSPAETICAILMGPNRAIGQEGLPPIQLNRRVILDDISSSALNQSTCVVDITWPDGQRVRRGCCVEVDGAAFHDDSKIDPSKLRGTNTDSARRAALAHMGLEVVTISWSQLENLEQWDTAVDVMYKHLGLTRRPLSAACLIKRQQLHDELLNDQVH